MSTDAAEGGDFLSQVTGKFNELKDEAVDTFKKETAQGGALDEVKEKLTEAFEGVKDKIEGGQGAAQ